MTPFEEAGYTKDDFFLYSSITSMVFTLFNDDATGEPIFTRVGSGMAYCLGLYKLHKVKVIVLNKVVQ